MTAGAQDPCFKPDINQLERNQIAASRTLDLHPRQVHKFMRVSHLDRPDRDHPLASGSVGAEDNDQLWRCGVRAAWHRRFNSPDVIPVHFLCRVRGSPPPPPSAWKGTRGDGAWGAREAREEGAGGLRRH